MRPVEFSAESILQAGQTLRAAGRNVTGFALRQKVGGGNPARLRQVWDDHLASQAAPAQVVAALPAQMAADVALLTQELAERLALLARTLHEQALKAAQEDVVQALRAAGLRHEQAERELADAARTVDELESALDRTHEDACALQARLVEAQAGAQAQAVELARLRERLAGLEQTAQAAAGQHATALAMLSAQVNAVQQGYREQHARAGQCEAERDQARRDAGAAREEAAQMRGQVTAMQAQAAELRRALAAK